MSDVLLSETSKPCWDVHGRYLGSMDYFIYPYKGRL